MRFEFDADNQYEIAVPEAVATPRLLVFEEAVTENIARMKFVLESALPGSGFDLLCAHVKTHKSAHTLSLLMEAGVTFFKVSLNEVDLCLSAGVPELFVAYPLLDDQVRRLAALQKTHPETVLYVQAGSLAQAEVLREVARKEGITWRCFMDIDVGMHRTGLSSKEGAALYREISGWPEIQLAGLHGYDGHIHQATEAGRKEASAAAMDHLTGLFDTLTAEGLAVPAVMTAGSPSFFSDLPLLLERLTGKTRVLFSPGTWIYWDSGYNRLLPGAFRMAAVILARVLERHENRLTLNLGHKRWAADQGPVEVFSVPGAAIYSYNEEHTVLSVPPDCRLDMGDYVLLAPKHVCSTVNLWEHYALMGADGEIRDVSVPVAARNR